VAAFGFEVGLVIILFPLAVIWLWDVWQDVKSDSEEDGETLLLTGELSEGMTKEGVITYKWN